MLDMVLDGTGEDDAFDVAADGGQRLGIHRMVDALDLLLDDRSFVKVGGYIMRRGADQLDAAGIGLLIRRNGGC
jgi:hypothetical protein